MTAPTCRRGTSSSSPATSSRPVAACSTTSTCTTTRRAVLPRDRHEPPALGPVLTDPSWIDAKIGLIADAVLGEGQLPGHQARHHRVQPRPRCHLGPAAAERRRGRRAGHLRTREARPRDVLAGRELGGAGRGVPIFRNYDGKHHGFGYVGVSARSSDQRRVSVFAARVGKSGPLTVVVVNKATTPFEPQSGSSTRGCPEGDGVAVRRRGHPQARQRPGAPPRAPADPARHLGHPDPGTPALVTRAVDRSVARHRSGAGRLLPLVRRPRGHPPRPGRLDPQRPDGLVRTHAEGPDDAVDEFVAWCGQGPPAARVEDVALTDVDPTGATSFDITH